MPLTDIFDLINDTDMQIPGGLIVTRSQFTTAQNTYGDFIPSAPTIFRVDPIMVHTASARDLLQLPEADRQFETICAYTQVRLYCDESFQDVLTYQGRLWKIVKIADYSIQGGGYWAAAQLREQVAS